MRIHQLWYHLHRIEKHIEAAREHLQHVKGHVPHPQWDELNRLLKQSHRISSLLYTNHDRDARKRRWDVEI